MDIEPAQAERMGSATQLPGPAEPSPAAGFGAANAGRSALCPGDSCLPCHPHQQGCTAAVTPRTRGPATCLTASGTRPSQEGQQGSAGGSPVIPHHPAQPFRPATLPSRSPHQCTQCPSGRRQGRSWLPGTACTGCSPRPRPRNPPARVEGKMNGRGEVQPVCKQCLHVAGARRLEWATSRGPTHAPPTGRWR